MKVFYFITKSENGGAQTVIYELLLAHKALGDSVVVMAYPGGWLEQQTRLLGYIFLPNSKMKKTYNIFCLLQAGRIFLKAVKEFSPDIVSCHSSFSGFIGRIVLRGQYPTVYTAHGWGFTDGTPFIRKVIAVLGEKITARYCDKIICVSEFDRKLALRYKITKEEQCITIHNGVIIDNKFADPNTNDYIEIIFPGRLAKPKRQDLLLYAIAGLPKDIKNKIHVTFSGGGIRGAILQTLADKLQVDRMITITGEIARSDNIELMSRAQIFVLLSDWEGLPMTLLEALQIGLPIIASGVGGIPEVIDSRQAIIVENKNIDSIKNAITKLVLDSEFRCSLSKASTNRGTEFTSAKMSTKVFSLYKEILMIRNANN
jgi:glycosyltransferase involved in cell wall biosynthesis